jgi:chaperonin GroES
MKVKPLADRVMVKLEKNEAKTAGGIIIPDNAQEKTQQGKVVEVGDDKEVIKVKAGQKVMYDKYAGTQIKINGEEHHILKMADIIAVVEKKKKKTGAVFADSPHNRYRFRLSSSDLHSMHIRA